MKINKTELYDVAVEKRLRNVRQVELKMFSVQNSYSAEIWL